jgi:putative nucleotidyltransferase with HDIG domain
VLRLIETDDYDINKITAVVRKDQVISARTIQLCNSALFTKRQDVTSLDHALVFLGRKPFLKLIITAALQGFYNQGASGYSLCKGGLYHHAIGTALIAEAIAAETDAIQPAVAYTAGLLHDIGKVVLDQYLADAYPLLYRELQDRMSDLINVETRTLGMDHTQAGELLAASWSLPQSLTDVIRHHHHPEHSPGNRRLVIIVHLADLLMSRFHTGLELERMGTGHLVNHLGQLALSTGDFQKLVDLIPDPVFAPVAEAL